MPGGDCDFTWSPVALRLLSNFAPSKAEYQAIRLAVCDIAADPEKGPRFFFESSPVPLRQFAVGRFLLIYHCPGEIEILSVLPRPT